MFGIHGPTRLAWKLSPSPVVSCPDRSPQHIVPELCVEDKARIRNELGEGLSGRFTSSRMLSCFFGQDDDGVVQSNRKELFFEIVTSTDSFTVSCPCNGSLKDLLAASARRGGFEDVWAHGQVLAQLLTGKELSPDTSLAALIPDDMLSLLSRRITRDRNEVTVWAHCTRMQLGQR